MHRVSLMPLLLLCLAAGAACHRGGAVDFSGPVAGWPAYGGGPAGLRYSPLTQITPRNVGRLRLAWIYRSGDVFDGSTTLGKSSFEDTPILVGRTLYICTPKNRVIALDAETGRERWSYDPHVDVSHLYVINCRGVSHWRDADAAAGIACRDRIFEGTLDGRLIALDAETGRPCADFGDGGSVDLTDGIGDVRPGEYGVTSPPAILGDRVITGSMVLDNRRVDAPGGVVRAYDARSGALLWAWDPVPPGAPPDPHPQGHRYRRGTTNAWAVFSVDAKRDLVYVPTGNTSPDYFGGLRHGLGRYSSSVVALDGATGRLRWAFQTVHHDLWDYDVPAQPTLFEFPGPKGPIPALVEPTKTSRLFFLDRETGRPLFPVEERPAPQAGAAPGETLSPTQPTPLLPPPLDPQRLDPKDAFGFTPYDRNACRKEIASLRSDGVFTPPSIQGSVQLPGMIGGMNWGGAALDPRRGILVVNSQRIATKIRLIPRAAFRARYGDHPPAYGVEPMEGTPYALERVPLLSPFGAPCNPPPWGVLTAVDVASGRIRWQVPLGTTRDQAPFPLWFHWGTPNLGGPLITGSGLVFIGATTDFALRAFDLETGAELWSRRLPTSAQATPMTYRLGSQGRQFVVIAAGGHGILGTPPGDALMAFVLP